MNPLIIAAVMYSGRKIVGKVGPTVLKEGSKLAFNFINTSDKNISANTKNINLSKKVEVIDNDLSVPKNYIAKQIIKITQEISDDLSIVKGQNEILFLSNSIDYFLKGHNERTGIDRGISYALQYDIAAVINHIRSNQQLRFPGYMLHQCSSLASTIKDYNLFYDSVLNDGHVKEWEQDTVNEELERKYGPHGESNPVAPYMPYEYQMNWLRGRKNPSKWPIKLPFFGSSDETLDEAHDSLVILSKELIANEALERRIIDKLASLPDYQLVINPYIKVKESN